MSFHTEDVSTVKFFESSQMFVTGSDDSFIKIWDLREMGRTSRSCGCLVGHLEGLTSIDSKMDGRYLVSNSKDQTIKLWDVRKMVSDSRGVELYKNKNRVIPELHWDYRCLPARAFYRTTFVYKMERVSRQRPSSGASS